MVAWAADGGVIFLADSTTDFAPVMTNGKWATTFTPALEYVPAWGVILVAWLDDNQIKIGSSADNFNESVVIYTLKGGISASATPSLTYGEGLVYVAWVDQGTLGCAYMSVFGIVTMCNISYPIPATFQQSITIQYLFGQLYVTGGTPPSGGSGEPNSEGDSTPAAGVTRVFVSSDQYCTSFKTAYVGKPHFSVGSPTLVYMSEMYFFAWTDPTTLNLTVGVSFDLMLGIEATTILPYRCAGAPTLYSFSNSLVFGWSEEDTSAFHTITLGVVGNVLGSETRFSIKTPGTHAAPVSSIECSNATDIWNPVSQKCVPLSDCEGKCVQSSYHSSPFGPIFNPITWEFCMKSNKCANE